MKCFLLAGGKGTGLWPLSRNDLPKQFLRIQENRSIFQDTIARNLPFCDEFVILTYEQYAFITEGQLRAFQGLNYRCLFEPMQKNTAAILTLACMMYNDSEVIFVAPADQIIGSSSYKDSVLAAQKLAKTGQIVAFGVKPTAPITLFGYIEYDKTKVVSFHEKPDSQTAGLFLEKGNYLWNSGNYVFRIGDFLNAVKKHAPDLFDLCGQIKHTSQRHKHDIHFSAALFEKLPSVSVEKAVMEVSDQLSVVPLCADWCDVGELEMLTDYMHADYAGRVIQYETSNVTVINRARDKLIVTNKVDDLIVVNTEDAIYLSKKGCSGNIKAIMNTYNDQYAAYFEISPLRYRAWGNYEVLLSTQDYTVKRATVYPGRSQVFHKHNLRSEHWSIVKGVGTITLGKEVYTLKENESIFVPIGMVHKVANEAPVDLIIIEVAVGLVLSEEDNVHITEISAPKKVEAPEIVRLEPAFKDYLWGGTNLRSIYNKKCDYDVIAESWELSAHEDGQSIVASGRYKGMYFSEYLDTMGKSILGWKCENFDRFPVLIKFIDAKNKLSVQVHPDNEYSLLHDNEYGKMEVWYIMDCTDTAIIHYGFRQNISKEELKRRICENTVLEVLNEIKVKKGDVFFIDTGIIHAIGKDIFLCEIQQNSNCTYRLYDYDRTDNFGNKRELHLEKALDVIDFDANVSVPKVASIHIDKDCEVQTLIKCQYFESVRYSVKDQYSIQVDESSFYSIVIVEGQGVIHTVATDMPFTAADSFFIPAGLKTITIKGNCTFIGTHV